MEPYCSLHSPTVTTIPSLSQSGFTEKPLLRGQVLKFSNSKRYPHARKLGFLHIKAQASGCRFDTLSNWNVDDGEAMGAAKHVLFAAPLTDTNT
ncbi:unnamed protein product [Prunus armeniaca]|uniref:Uncharacterized protein n=1 Tax=Prunus armeniaca TaxID=36596 RepID=A0A6J5WIG1_PRUAR|nr:unnamed protein product [Prunus armeniaca]